VAWAWRSQWGDTLPLALPSRPARVAAAQTMRSDRRGVQVAAAVTRGEDWRIEVGAVAERGEVAPDVGWKQDGARLGAFAEDGDLAAPVTAGVEIAPGEAGDLRDAQTGAIEQAQQHAVAGVGLEREQLMDRGLVEDALAEGVLGCVQFQNGADVDGQIADALGEGE
jgi:hypothetical protein